jgi:hypothetical protein
VRASPSSPAAYRPASTRSALAIACCAACRFAVGAGGTVAQAPTMKHVRRIVAKGRRAGSGFWVDRFIIMFPLKFDWRAAAAMLLFELTEDGSPDFVGDDWTPGGMPTRTEKWFNWHRICASRRCGSQSGEHCAEAVKLCPYGREHRLQEVAPVRHPPFGESTSWPQSSRWRVPARRTRSVSFFTIA